MEYDIIFSGITTIYSLMGTTNIPLKNQGYYKI